MIYILAIIAIAVVLGFTAVSMSIRELQRTVDVHGELANRMLDRLDEIVKDCKGKP